MSVVLGIVLMRISHAALSVVDSEDRGMTSNDVFRLLFLPSSMRKRCRSLQCQLDDIHLRISARIANSLSKH